MCILYCCLPFFPFFDLSLPFARCILHLDHFYVAVVISLTLVHSRSCFTSIISRSSSPHRTHPPPLSCRHGPPFPMCPSHLPDSWVPSSAVRVDLFACLAICFSLMLTCFHEPFSLIPSTWLAIHKEVCTILTCRLYNRDRRVQVQCMYGRSKLLRVLLMLRHLSTPSCHENTGSASCLFAPGYHAAVCVLVRRLRLVGVAFESIVTKMPVVRSKNSGFLDHVKIEE